LYFIKNDRYPLSDAFKIVTVKEGPIGGNLVASPRSGIALKDVFTLSAPDWYLRDNEDALLSYQFFTVKEDTNEYQPISPIGSASSIRTILPTVSKLAVRVFESPRTYTEMEINIVITFDEVVSITKARSLELGMSEDERLIVCAELNNIRKYEKELADQISNSTANYVMEQLEPFELL
jgi:hypothetical protein